MILSFNSCNSHSNTFSIYVEEMKYKMKKGKNIWTREYATSQDYDSFNNIGSVSVFREDSHGQVGYSYADDRFKVLAEMTKGCEAILNIKIFGTAEVSSDANFSVDDKCSDRPIAAGDALKETKKIMAQRHGKN